MTPLVKLVQLRNQDVLVVMMSYNFEIYNLTLVSARMGIMKME